MPRTRKIKYVTHGLRGRDTVVDSEYRREETPQNHSSKDKPIQCNHANTTRPIIAVP